MKKRVRISSIVENQLPEYVQSEFPLAQEFLKQYYISLFSNNQPLDISQNIDQFIKLDNITNLIEETELLEDVSYNDTTIKVLNSAGFPDRYGLIKIDDEIIGYEYKDNNNFYNCYRSFSGIVDYVSGELVFEDSQLSKHSKEYTNENGEIQKTLVKNLSVSLLKQFLIKVKTQISPGFENRDLYTPLNENLFLKQSSDFYKSKGTEESFRILFNALYGNVDDKVNNPSKFYEVITPSKYLIEPSSSQYRITQDLIVESIDGNPLDLLNKTLIQPETDFTQYAQGTVTKVEKITRDNKNIGNVSFEFDEVPSNKSAFYFLKEYYIVSLDYEYNRDIFAKGSTRGIFTINPKTKIIGDVSIGQEYIDVDSTIGFPESGLLLVDLENGTSLEINYTTKTSNQFLGCSGISQDIRSGEEIKTTEYAYGESETGDQIRVRISGVIENYNIIGSNLLQKKDSDVIVKTLGDDLSGPIVDSWLLNIANWYDIEKIEVDTLNSYIITTYDSHKFNIQDSVYLITTSGLVQTIDQNIIVTSINSNNEFVIQSDVDIDITKTYRIYKKLSKLDHQNYKNLNYYNANVTNVYSNSNDYVYVTAPSFPKYADTLKAADRKSISSSIGSTSISFSFPHGFYSGEKVIVKAKGDTSKYLIGFASPDPEDLERKLQISATSIGILNEDFINFESLGFTSYGELQVEILKNNDLNSEVPTTKLLEPQKLIKKIQSPVDSKLITETESGPTGIFVNGVELLNYKSNDYINYGEITEISVINSGNDYDVIDPPILQISDDVGVGASGRVSVKGSLERIDILNPGHNYLEVPKIEIKGGNGKNAKAVSNLISYTHKASFNSKNISDNEITFIDDHKFSNNESVIFIPSELSPSIGLSTNSTYFVSVTDKKTLKLYNSFTDSANNLNPVSLSSGASSICELQSVNKKRRVGSITIIDGGENYTNRKYIIDSSGISTSLNIVQIKNHKFNDKEIVEYHSTITPISGLTSSTNYYVKKIDDDNFRLYELGNSGVTTDFYYNTNQYVNFADFGEGNHIFKYPDIEVTLSGKTGIVTSIGQTDLDFSAQIRPIFRGEIESVILDSNGSGYGNPDILNLNRLPLVELSSGKDGEIELVVNNGKIESAFVKNIGQQYNSPPTIKIVGDGFGAQISPIIDNSGRLIDLYISSKGDGYTQEKTSAIVINAGTGANLLPIIKKWTVNNVERLILDEKVTDDDGYLAPGLNRFGLQYFHLYPPRELRKILPTKTPGNTDLNFTFIEQLSSDHSPIIGWAYDGHPIYGPYGFENEDGTGGIVPLKSGYESISQEGRPSLNDIGFFVEDFIFTNNGHLDEHNGRFCVTPEFPNGTYAYFCTIDTNNTVDLSRYFRPEFPYVIGNSYKSNPIDFNFNSLNNQDLLDFNTLGVYRNSSAYNIENLRSGYDFFLNYDDTVKLNVNSIKSGVVNSIGIVEGGINYQVNDRVIFDNTDTNGSGLKARVSFVGGVDVNSVSFASSIVQDVEFIPYRGTYLGFSTIPHGLLENDIVTITSPYENLQVNNIDLKNNQLRLKVGLSTVNITGIVTYIDVYGDLSFPTICENDIYVIGDERLKILEIDEKSSRIRVIRNWDGTTSGITSHSPGVSIREDTRKVYTNLGIRSSYDYKITREYYFNPAETIGVGTDNTTGITTTLSISNPGIGNTILTLPLKTILIKSHNLNTGDSLIYKSNGGDTISVSTDTSTSFNLENNSIVYATKISNDLIGISTSKLAINSSGDYSGIGTISSELLYFTGIGTGSYHSLTSVPQNNLVAEIQKNFVTVSVAQTHRLSLRDTIKLDVKSGLSATCIIKYDDYNRRLIANSKSISSVDTTKNLLRIENHNFISGEKVIFNESTPIGGLNDNSIYYVSVYDSDRIRLCSSTYDISIKKYIRLTSSGTGQISQINPNIICYKDQILNIDLSDSTLAYEDSTGEKYPAFIFKLYTDESFTTRYDTFENTIIEKSGIIGRDAVVKIKISDNTPEKLYYNLIPIENPENSIEKLEIIVDDEQLSNNKISVLDSKYSGTYTIYDVDDYAFKINIVDVPETDQYISTTSAISYSTNSLYNYGPISEIEIIDKGKNYQKLPKVINVNSLNGRDSLLELETTNIGSIESVNIKNYGFDYSADLTLEPKIIYPTILKVSTLYTIDSIGVTSAGFGYNTAPDLLVFDGLSKEIVEDISLSYDIINQKVDIIENTSGISKIPPQIIPINNSNGIGVTGSYFDPVTKVVTLELSPEFSDPEDFPFEVGGRVVVEGMNVDVGTSTTIKGYNSENYGFALFTIVSLDDNLGGAGATISYSMEDYLEDGDVPGEYDPLTSNGVVIPEKFFPTFDVKLKDTEFFEGETVKSGNSVGKVEYWDSSNSYLSVSSKDNFEIGKLIVGQSSKTKSIIEEEFKTYGFCEVKAFSIVDRGWNTEKGFLNNQFQRVHDSDYYQYFSYAVKSEVSLDRWNDPVSNLNHTAGFKKFSDLVVRREQNTGFRTDQNEGAFTAVANLFSDIDLECKNYFDYAYENYELFGKNSRSNQIIFKNRIIQDYIEAKSNRALIIDDISDQFKSSDSLTPKEYSDIYSFELNLDNTPRHIKTFINIKNKNFSNESEFSIVSILHNNTDFYLNTYGEIFSTINVGEFDLYLDRRIDTAYLRFYPTSPFYNDFDINFISFELNDYISGIGSTSLGDIAKIDTHNTILPSGTSTETNIVSISSTYRSAKISVLIGSTDENNYEYSEFNILHNGSEVFVERYGNLESDTSLPHSGLGTFGANLVGDQILLKFTPNSSLFTDYYVNSYSIGIGSTSAIISGQTDIGNSLLESSYVSISSSPTPVSTGIVSNTNSYQSSYYILSIEDTTNNEYQLTELITHYNSDSNYINWAQYGDTTSSNSLGIITCGIVDSEKSIVYFTPNENIDCEIRIFEIDVNNLNISSQIDLNNSIIKTGKSDYFRNQFDVVKSFDLKHNNYNIFQRSINPQTSGVIDINSDTINIENHFFSTGEEIVYEFDEEPIGIATTVVPGIGSTDKLPSTLYVIKNSDNIIRVAASSTECLAFGGTYFDITSVGAGTSHKFTSKKQNTKCLITIDNIIQSPVVATSKTTILLENLTALVNELYVENPNNISSGDFLKINDEIVKVNAVGVGSTNKLVVDRSIFGTGISSHTQNDLITKLDGNYNIIDNTLYFSEPPYGFVPNENLDDPYEIDYKGLQISSKFSGRVFLRSGVPDTDIDAYENNYIFDSLTEDFNGVDLSFELTQNGESIAGFSTNNSVVLVRNIFQEPERVGGAVPIEGAYNIVENSGITSITFNGSNILSSNDINSVNIPRGGIIVSVASTKGFGYQPLVAAGGTALVSAAGTIQSISIGNSGSGYRVGIQTIVNVGIQTQTYGVPRIEFIGTASISNGNVVGVSITNPGVGYTSYHELFTTNVSSNVASGSTIIPVDSVVGITSLNYIDIGGKLSDVRIVGVGTTSIFIGSGSTIATEISSGLEVVVKDYNPPEVVFDDPLSYTNIPLIYSSSSSGIGTLASLDLVVSQDSSVLTFEFNNTGYGYEPGEILTIPIGGLSGIQTNTSGSFEEFQLIVERIYNDNFFGWSMGTIQVFDPIDDLINGTRKIFPLRINREQVSIEKQPTSSIDLKSTLLIFVDDVLQVPGESYIFDGGSIFQFIQPPNPGSKTKIMFYRGTDGVDAYDVDIQETVKIGDTLRLSGPSYYYDNSRNVYTPQGEEDSLTENSRIVQEIIGSKISRTNLYSGVGINSDPLLLRNVRWCKQRNDLFVDGLKVSKARLLYEPLVYPVTNIIQNVGINTTEIFVESLKTFFDSYDEYYLLPDEAKVVEIISQEETSSGIASVVVSSGGTVQNIILIDGGRGYTRDPQVSIGNPLGFGIDVGIGTTATAIASITAGIITTITITNPGSGYTNTTNVPIIIEPPDSKIEEIRQVSYEGDFGIITGIASTSIVGVAETGLWLDLYIPKDSFIRDGDINPVGIATTGISGIQTGYYFSLYQSEIGDGTISYRQDGSVIGIGTTYIDNVYQVLDYNIEQKNIIGVGQTYVNRVLISVDSHDEIIQNITFDSTSITWDNIDYSFDSLNPYIFYGKYSWGRISFGGRNVTEFEWYGQNGIGINTSPLVRRIKPLKYKDYTN